jgi:heterotetrameric sarcosine oxidase delta subunit
MILIRCPWCGPRDAAEFHCSGETRPRPDAMSATPLQWRDYLYFPANPRGPVTETWYHRMGCRKFFAIERDTDTNESRPLPGSALERPR